MTLDIRYALHHAINIGTICIFAPVITLFCQHKGMDLSQIGLFFGVYFLAIILFELPSGVWADRFGRLNVFMLSKMLDCLNFALLFYFDYIPALYAASFVGGIARAMGSDAMEAWYVDQLKKVHRYHLMPSLLSNAHGWALVAMAFGAVSGAALVACNLQLPNNDSPYHWVLIVAFTMHLTLGISVPFCFHEGEVKQAIRKERSDVNVIKKILMACIQHPILKRVLGLQIIHGFLLSSIQTYWQPQLLTMLSEKTDVFVFGWVSALFFFSAALSAAWIKRSHKGLLNNNGRQLLGIFGASSVLVLLLATTNSALLFIVVYLCFGFAIFAIKPLLAILMHHYIEDHQRATALSILSLALNLGGVLVGLALGTIADSAGVRAVWVISGVSGLTFVALLMRVETK